MRRTPARNPRLTEPSLEASSSSSTASIAPTYGSPPVRSNQTLQRVLASPAPVQRMPLENFIERVKAKFPQDWKGFLDYFERQYLEQELAGAFLTDGVAYGWDWRNYAEDLDEDLLESEFQDYQARRQARQAEDLGKAAILAGSLPKGVEPIGLIDGSELIAPNKAVELLRQTHALTKEGKYGELRQTVDARTAQAILNSVSGQTRANPVAQEAMLDLAIAFDLSVPEQTPMIETQTRFGFEIEPGFNMKIRNVGGKGGGKGGGDEQQDEAIFDLLDSMVNVTLASTDLLEFIVDDLNEKAGTMQVEFRTKPLPPDRLMDLRKIRAEIDRSISKFPIDIFKNPKMGNREFSELLAQSGWRPAPRLREATRNLAPLQPGRISSKGSKIQHVTLSIPLASTLGAKPQDRELLLPGSGGAQSMADLLEFFFGKIADQTDQGLLDVTTTGRNRNAPNMKTALDTLIGLLGTGDAREIAGRIGGRLPRKVNVAGEQAQIETPRLFDELPQFPRLNPEGERGYLASEEKLKPPLFDVERQDVRVLVEHRRDSFVDAVREAEKGKTEAIRPYIRALKNLDRAKAGPAFAQWFE